MIPVAAILSSHRHAVIDFQSTIFTDTFTLILLDTFTPTQSATFHLDPAEIDKVFRSFQWLKHRTFIRL